MYNAKELTNTETITYRGVNLILDMGEYYREYDDIMLGKKSLFSSYLMSKDQKNKSIERVLKYAFENYLKWTPEQVRDCLTPTIIEQMKLSSLINRLECPLELDRKRDLYFVAWALYPKTKNANKYDLIVKLYNDVLTGKRDKFPKGYFNGTAGYSYAKICLKFLIQEHLIYHFDSIESMYRFFSNTHQATKVLHKYRLSIPLNELYVSPLEYFHDTLSETQKNESLYKAYLSDIIKGKEDYDE